MIRGNEIAIDLGLEVLLALRPDRPLSSGEVAAYCDAAREVLGLPTKPFQKQDLFFLEHRALNKMRRHCRANPELKQVVAQLTGVTTFRDPAPRDRFSQNQLRRHAP